MLLVLATQSPQEPRGRSASLRDRGGGLAEDVATPKEHVVPVHEASTQPDPQRIRLQPQVCADLR
jgi:hypothetical protein